MTAYRFEGWSVTPTFVPNTPNAPITLLFDENAFTQLAGTSVVAWQTPWSEVSNLQLVRLAKGMALFATIGGTRYCWRSTSKDSFQSLSEAVTHFGGNIAKKPRRAEAFVVTVLVAVLTLAGVFGGWLNRHSSSGQELKDVSAANLTLKDLPSGWTTGQSSLLSYIVPSPNEVITATPTTTPKKNSLWSDVMKYYENCVGVSNATDRMYGLAGQEPDYQKSSPVFTSTSFGGIQVASTAQYYHTTQMVNSDTRQMTSEKNFGACFASSNAAVIMTQVGAGLPTKQIGVNFHPFTFAHGWVRGGVATIDTPGLTSSLYFSIVVATHGNYEVTLMALSAQWPAPKSFISNLTNTVLSRITGSNSNAV